MSRIVGFRTVHTNRQYARLVDYWIERIGLNPADYETHSLPPTKADACGSKLATRHGALADEAEAFSAMRVKANS
jgi:hypothetical protein